MPRELARNLPKHTFREYALRQAVLEEIFVDWSSEVIEVLYEAVRIGECGKSPAPPRERQLVAFQATWVWSAMSP